MGVDFFAESLSSLKSALGMSMMQKTMNKDAQGMAILMQGMEETNTKIMEQSVTPHKGGNVDIKI